MGEVFQQIGFINAILGGFAITFLSVVIISPTEHRIIDWVVGVITLATACFILSAIGATFSAVVANWIKTGDLPQVIKTIHQVISLLFLAGAVLLFAGIGMSGWMRSRHLGIVTTVIMCVATIGGFFIILPFLR